jgi:hypothetical protein
MIRPLMMLFVCVRHLGVVVMRMLLTAAAGSLLAIPALPASQAAAQSWYGGGDYRAASNIQRRCDRALRRADSRREYNDIRRECRRALRAAQRGYYSNSQGYGWSGDNGYYGRQTNDRYYWDGYRWRARY